MPSPSTILRNSWLKVGKEIFAKWFGSQSTFPRNSRHQMVTMQQCIEVASQSTFPRNSRHQLLMFAFAVVGSSQSTFPRNSRHQGSMFAVLGLRKSQSTFPRNSRHQSKPPRRRPRDESQSTFPRNSRHQLGAQTFLWATRVSIHVPAEQPASVIINIVDRPPASQSAFPRNSRHQLSLPPPPSPACLNPRSRGTAGIRRETSQGRMSSGLNPRSRGTAGIRHHPASPCQAPTPRGVFPRYRSNLPPAASISAYPWK